MLLIYGLLILCAYFVARHFWEKLMLSDMKNRPVFVTGCDSGFGYLLALKLAENGLPVYAGCLTEEGAEKLMQIAKNDKSPLETVPLDVTSDTSVNRAFDFVQQKLQGKGLWAVVNNAGILGTNGPDDFLTIEEYEKAMQVNVLGVIRVTHKFKQLLKLARGRLISTASVAGRMPFRSLAPYVTSKYACEGYMDVVRQELRDFGVSCHIVEPGIFRNTNLLEEGRLRQMTSDLWHRQSESIQRQYGSDFLGKWIDSQLALVRDVGNENPQMVVETYWHAIAARFPRKRYPVGLDARLFWIPVSCLPTDIQDSIFVWMEKLRKTPLPAVAVTKNNN